MPRIIEKEFKEQAVRLVTEQGMTATRVAKDLEVSYSAVIRWVREFKESGKDAFPGKGKLKPQDEQVRQLEREVRRLTIERDILKKTIGYFADKP